MVQHQVTINEIGSYEIGTYDSGSEVELTIITSENACSSVFSTAYINTGEGSTWYADEDGDGFGNPDISQVDCEQPDGFVLDNTDCDDTEETVFPNAEELCDGLDNNCNGDVDEDDICDSPTDSDDDGIPDDDDICPGFDDNMDIDNDGTPDGCDDTPNGDD